MALTVTYDATLSRVRLSAATLGATATYCTFVRSIDNFLRTATVRGGAVKPVTGEAASVDDYEFAPGVATTYRVTAYDASDAQVSQFDASITQDLDGVWLKVPAAPFLNRPVTASVRTDIARKARGGLFDVVGRSYPVAVGDVRGSKEFTLQVRTDTSSDERDLDYALATGDVIFLQRPSAMDQFPGGYFAVGDVSRSPENRYSERRVWDVALVEVAAPAASIVGSAYTCASVLAEYATVTAVITGNATIAALLERTGTPSEVIVP